ncbi:acetyl-CoA synthetase-like protein [Hyaloscypha variabilis F]|uniref:Acetyl-CoA synthetase-like protein n=1 Tax=Hyaloscypha variabilis (strain UAMH 11265 / GT02V1 / F) TaxID=1149755 RepID=A0A2J6R4R0_HYAVF|nr:acetyl-CoA synthetase-like protein [Hyaloscypha variabilis F]
MTGFLVVFGGRRVKSHLNSAVKSVNQLREQTTTQECMPPYSRTLQRANPGYTARELTDHLKITEAKFTLTELKTLDNSVAAAKECDIPDANISPIMELLLQHGEQDWVEVDDPSTPAAYVSTNETTGLPKSAIIPHSYLDSQAAIIEKLLPGKKNISYLISIPPFHLFTIHVQHHLPLRSNMTAYNLPRFEETSFVKTVETFKIARTMAVLPMLLALSKYPPARLGSLKQILIGGFLSHLAFTRTSATLEAFTQDNWIRTGDIGYTKDKNWYVVDRAKDLIKVHVGVTRISSLDGCGKSAMAFIIAEKGSTLDETQIKLFLANRLARYKNVEEICFVDKIPRNPIRKILRRVVRDM